MEEVVEGLPAALPFGPEQAATPLEVVVVHRDQPEACVRTVLALHRQGLPVHVTVVDNGSGAAGLSAVRALARRLPTVEVVALGRNTGFGPAANVGLRRWLAQDEGEWVAVAPHDALPEPGCLARILAAVASRPDAGLVSGEFGRAYDSRPVVDRYIGGYVSPGRAGDGWEDADFPHGTLLLARRAALTDIGLFDERYFAYCEEADLGVRARRAGWKVGIIWGAVVKNHRSAESEIVRYLKLRNTLLLVREHYGSYPATIRCTFALLTLAVRSFNERSSPRNALRRVEGQAILDFIRGRFGPPPPSLLPVET
ncbi:MAG TPA: glycosyltransferase [Acidimicrobiales bacterium]|nr:glycosyltransferase [Acidimicrobiales bacterium]